ncbi:MAG: dihydroorotate dehydrogenase [Oscillospiraceae bacterium]|nr:dihydroorotate dehydrogenase [Oscillospiraceae bacterium]
MGNVKNIINKEELDLFVEIAGVKFKNPVFTASGTCGFGREYSPYYSLSELGAITTKGISIKPKEGNAPPRVAETPAGMLNAIGLQNPGAKYFIENELPNLKKYDTKIIANIFGDTSDEYCEVAEVLSETEIDMLEVNISCPNVKCGGIYFGTDPAMAEDITAKIKKRSKKPIAVKLSPNVTDIVEIAKAVENGGADCISMINTLVGMRIDTKTRRPVLKNNIGGLSGAAIRPIAARMIWQVRSKVGLPIIGMGGVCCAEDAIELMLAGADAIAVGTASFGDPTAVVKVISGIEDYMIENNIKAIRDITGALKAW